jgi:predicted nucleic acid-binding protein
MVIVDSSVFVALERRGLSVEALYATAPEEQTAIAAITASELLYGVHRADTPERALRRSAYVETILSVVAVLPFDLQTARIHSRLWADLRARPIGAHDLQIAATALAHSASLLTANTREFLRVSGLVVITPNR